MRLCLRIWTLFLLAALVPAHHAGAQASRAESILQRVNANIGGLQDYEFLVDTDCRVGSKSEARSFRVWFKQPGMLRVKVLRGRSRGSEVVIASDGGIRGRKAGLLKSFVTRLDADDSRLRNLRGIPVSEFLWSTFYGRFRERAALPGARMTLLPRQNGGPHEIQLVYSDQGRSMREVVRVDPDTWFLQEHEVYDGTTRVDHAVFHGWKTNAGLREAFFRL